MGRRNLVVKVPYLVHRKSFWVNPTIGESYYVFMALGINQVTYSNRKFCRSVGPGFATLGTSR